LILKNAGRSEQSKTGERDFSAADTGRVRDSQERRAQRTLWEITFPSSGGERKRSMPPKKRTRTIAEWFEYGRQAFLKPDGLEAVRAMEHVIDRHPAYRHPDGDNPYFYLGKINEVEGREDAAIGHYTRALAVDVQDEESRIGRASCYTVTGQHRRAIADLTVLLRQPEDRRAIPRKHLLYVIAENYRRLGDWGQALHYGKQALAAAPGNRMHRELFEAISEKING
jgi:tetratricopeptide (TPR) repeat protein